MIMMELDEIKKIWQDMDLLKEQKKISDERIKRMLRNEGKSALDKLIRTARFFAIIIIPLGLLLCACSYRFFEEGGYYPVVPLSFLLLCILMMPFETYLYRLLKGIDFSIMSVREVSEKILKYYRIIRKGQFFGMILFIVYLAIWYFLYYKLTFGDEIVWFLIIYMAVLYTLGLIAIPILYKKIYYRHINKIKESLKELEEFDNN